MIELVDRVSNREATDADMLRLEALLADNADARRFYLRRMRVDADLVLDLAEQSEEFGPVQPRSSSRSLLQRMSSRPVASAIGVAAITLAATLLVMAVLPISPFVARNTKKTTHDKPTDDKPEHVARLVNWRNDEWLEDSRPPLRDPRLEVGRRLVLQQGLAEIVYDKGARVILEGPTEYEVQSAKGGYLRLGKLVARVEKKDAQGFFVDTPAGRAEDLGTEFGVEVDRSGTALTQVLEGRVQVSGPGADGIVVRELTANEAIRSERVSDDQVKLVTAAATPGYFVQSLPEIKITTVGDGIGYDEPHQPAFLSTDVAKPFDVDGDNVYGTAGYLMFGGNNELENQSKRPFGDHIDRLPSWVSVSAGPRFSGVAYGYAHYAAIDDPTKQHGESVADWSSRSGIALSEQGDAGDWLAMVKFTIKPGTPQHFRLGVMAGNEAGADGRWDSTGIRLTGPDGAIATVAELPVTRPLGAAGWVFFDIDTDGATSGNFTVFAQKRLPTQGPSVGGLSFDIPVADPMD